MIEKCVESENRPNIENFAFTNYLGLETDWNDITSMLTDFQAFRAKSTYSLSKMPEIYKNADFRPTANFLGCFFANAFQIDCSSDNSPAETF